MSVVVAPIGECYCPTCETSYGEGAWCPRDGAALIRLSMAHDPNLGRELDGRFTVLERLGEGGMGVVYRAQQHSVDREVAIKVIRANQTGDPAAMKRFLREVKLTSRINHPNAIGALDFGQTGDGLLYLVMELVTGRTLEQVIASEGALAPARVVKIGAQICDALEAAHRLHIIHRDLKPGNVMLLARDFVKVLDFGLATTLELDDRLSSSSNGRSIVGTPAYLAPERARDGSSDGRSDLYSLGCVLFTLVSGRPPFRAASVNDVVAMHVGRAPPRLVGVPPALAAVIERLLAKDPTTRYQTATETRAALEDAARELSGLARMSDGEAIGPLSSPVTVEPTQELSASALQRSSATEVVVPAARLRTRALGLALVAAGVLALVIGFASGDESAVTHARGATPPVPPAEPASAVPAASGPTPREPEVPSVPGASSAPSAQDAPGVPEAPSAPSPPSPLIAPGVSSPPIAPVPETRARPAAAKPGKAAPPRRDSTSIRKPRLPF